MPINTQSLNQIISDLKSSKKHCELLVVTKTRPVADIETLLQSGYSLFGENRVQEAEKKYFNLRKNFNFDLHLIGPLQSNKYLNALQLFDTIQTIDRKKIIDLIAKEIENNKNIRTKDFYIQVNIGNEDQKSGVNIDEVESIYNYATQKKLNVIGLMCIPPNNMDASFYFENMLNLKNKIKSNLKLSMGMSNDYLLALNYESNIVRIGSMIFNE